MVREPRDPLWGFVPGPVSSFRVLSRLPNKCIENANGRWLSEKHLSPPSTVHRTFGSEKLAVGRAIEMLIT